MKNYFPGLWRKIKKASIQEITSGNIIDTYQRRLCLGFLSDRWATQVPTPNDIL